MSASNAHEADGVVGRMHPCEPDRACPKPELLRPETALHRHVVAVAQSACVGVQVKAGMCCAHMGDLGQAMQLLEALLAESAAEYADLYMDVGDLLAAHAQHQRVRGLMPVRVPRQATDGSPMLPSVLKVAYSSSLMSGERDLLLVQQPSLQAACE